MRALQGDFDYVFATLAELDNCLMTPYKHMMYAGSSPARRAKFLVGQPKEKEMSADANAEEMVTITKKEFLELCGDSLFLNCLRNAGVDNWDGYDFAVDEYNEANGEGSD